MCFSKPRLLSPLPLSRVCFFFLHLAVVLVRFVSRNARISFLFRITNTLFFVVCLHICFSLPLWYICRLHPTLDITTGLDSYLDRSVVSRSLSYHINNKTTTKTTTTSRNTTTRRRQTHTHTSNCLHRASIQGDEERPSGGWQDRQGRLTHWRRRRRRRSSKSHHGRYGHD